jgi:RimJ/RimL family protein N-acetyltransferase
MTLPITTQRLILRRFTFVDVPDILEFTSHPSVARALPNIDLARGEDGVRVYIDVQKSYQPFEKGKVFDLAIERKEDGQVIGLLTLVCGDHWQGAIGWALGVKHRGRGYATEAASALIAYAFTRLGLHRIWAETTDADRASWQVMERVGMRQEGRLREAERRDGKWTDVLIYGVLAREYQERDG